MRTALFAILLFATTTLFAATTPRSREDFDFDWRFHLGAASGASQTAFDDKSWRELNVPHDFSAEGEFSRTNASGTGFLPGGIGWYRKQFVAPVAWKEKLVSIEFDGVAMNSEIWINGHYLGKRPYAYSTFNYDLTPYLRFGETNAIAVSVDHSQIADSRWYVGSGIYRHVWLIATEKTHVARHGIFITTPKVTAQNATLEIQTRIQNETERSERIKLITELLGPNGDVKQRLTNEVALSAKGDSLLMQTSEFPAPALWSPDSPNVYRARTVLRSGDQAVDEMETTFGIRSIRFDAQRGFFLNGQPMKFKGICMHHDAGVLGAAVPDQVLERRLRIAKEIGCNAIRTSHNPMAPELYDLCDRLGLIVMDEAFDEWTGAKHKWVEGWNRGTASLHGYADYFDQWAEADLREMVMRDRNHPSIVLWSIGNEVDYANDPFSYPTDGNQFDPKKPSAEILAKTAPRLIKTVRECDTSRPVTAALANIPASNATGLADLLDVVGYNYQIPQLEKDLGHYPNRKFVGSETQQGLDYVEAARNPRVTGQFLWVGFDFLGEAGAWPWRGSEAGAFDTCGFLKPRAFVREALWSEKPVVLLAVRGGRGSRGGGRFGGSLEAHWNWEDDSRASLPVEAYSNCKTVELFLNGESLGLKDSSEATNCIFRWSVPFKAGELKAVARTGDKVVENRLITAGKPACIELVPDKTTFAANGEDVANVELRLVDNKGVLVQNADALCSVEVTGAGCLLGFDNGDQRDMTPLKSPSRKLNHGRALVYVQAARRAGEVELKVTSAGLPDAQVQFKAE